MKAAQNHWLRFAGIAAIALATAGCGGGETTVRPFVKRGGDTATDKSPADKTDAKTEAKTAEKTGAKTPAEKTPPGPSKTDEKTKGP